LCYPKKHTSAEDFFTPRALSCFRNHVQFRDKYLVIDFDVRCGKPEQMTRETYIGITELTEEFGVSTRTLRFYEDRKLLSPFRRGRKRLYRPRDRIRLKLILRGKRLGISLDEIAEIIDLYDETSGPQKQIDKLLERIEARRQALLSQQQDIKDALRELATVEGKARAHLETLRVPAS